MKKLIPSIVLLLVSAILLGTSTYAWFSMNTIVTATNMEIKAVADKNLLITKTAADASDYNESVNMSISNQTLRPVSTIGGDVAAPAFFKVDTIGGIVSDNAARAADTTFTNAVENTDYIKATVWLKCVGSDTTNLIATINTSSGGDKLVDPAIRVMLVDRTNNKTYIYSPIANASYLTTGQALSAADGTNAAIVTSATSGTTVILASLTKDMAYQFDIYTWYEGEDVNCKTTNTLDLAEYVFDIQFNVD